MAETIIEKLRKSRQGEVQTGGCSFTVRRPTDEEAYNHFRSEVPVSAELLARFVVGWNLKEADILPGGGKAQVPYDPELAREWLADRADLWPPLLERITELYQAHAQSRETAPKN